MANYPSSMPTLTVPPAGIALGLSSPTQRQLAQQTADEILAIATELGTVPKGSFATVKDFLAFMARAHTVETITTAGAAQTFDLALGCTKILNLSAANCVLAAPTNLVGGSAVANFVEVIIKQDATGSRTVTWWSGIRWPGGGGPPALTITPNTGRDRFVLTSFSGGSSWDADYGLNLA